jgi:hypothetical protein
MSTFNMIPLVLKPAYAYLDVEEWAKCANRIAEEVYPLLVSLKDERLRAIELEHLEKGMVNWRAIGFGRLVFASNFRSESSEQADSLRGIVRDRASRYVKLAKEIDRSKLVEIYDSTKIRFDKGKGAPFWNPGTDLGAGYLLAIIGRKLKNLDDIRDVMHEWSGGAPMIMSMYHRVQGGRKPVTTRAYQMGNLFASRESVMPKVRTVKAPPYVENNLAAGYYDLLKTLIMEAYPNRHLTDATQAATIARSYEYLFASDLTTADDTISAQTLEMWHEEVTIPLTEALEDLGVMEAWEGSLVRAYDLSLVRRDILCPARSSHEKACILSMIGGVKSGDRGTTAKDLDIIGARCELKRRRLKEAGIDCEYMSWGDDILVMSNDARAEAEWFKDVPSENHLWKDKVEPDSTYMAKHMPEGYSYFSRMVIRRLNREPHEEPSNAIGAALSIAASRDALAGVKGGARHPLIDHYIDVVEKTMPRYKTACAIARQADTLQLMHAYEQLKMNKTQQQRAAATLADLMRGTSSDDEADTEGGDEIEGIVAPHLYSARLQREVSPSMSVGELRREETKWELKMALRKMVQKK